MWLCLVRANYDRWQAANDWIEVLQMLYAVITIRSKCRFIWNYDKILICVSCKRPREERTAWTLNLLVLWKVAVQCRTGALHCHCLLGNCVFIVVVLLHFQSTNAEWLTTLSSSNLNILFSFLSTSPYSRMIIEPDDRFGLLLCVTNPPSSPPILLHQFRLNPPVVVCPLLRFDSFRPNFHSPTLSERSPNHRLMILNLSGAAAGRGRRWNKRSDETIGK